MFTKPLLTQNRRVSGNNDRKGMEEIGRVTASDDATVALTWTQRYYKVVLECANVSPATDGVYPQLRTSSDGGSTYDSGASDYKYIANVLVGGIGGGGATAAFIALSQTTGNLLGNAANETVSLTIEIINPAATEYTQIQSYGGGIRDSDSAAMVLAAAGQRLSSADVDGVQFAFNSGNIASGEFRLYGLI